MKFYIDTRASMYVDLEVEANSEEEAMEKVRKGIIKSWGVAEDCGEMEICGDEAMIYAADGKSYEYGLVFPLHDKA